MQACYVNTTHPDFLNGHKAMSIVTERMNQNKPQHAEGKGGKVTPAQLNNNRDLEVDVKEEQSFFGTFFAKGQQRKKGVAAMEAVRRSMSLSSRRASGPCSLASHSRPPSSSPRRRSVSARRWRPR